MLLTFNIKHGRDFSAELTKARKVAEFALQTGSRTTKDVKDVGLPSAIANQVLRKYSNNSTIRKVSSVQLTVPGRAVKVNEEHKGLFITCLKLQLDISHLPNFVKVNQVELGREYAHVIVTINEPPVREVDQWVGVDLNSTGHVAVVANPTIGKVQKYGKEAPHIRRKYSKIRRKLQIQGHYKAAKKKDQTEGEQQGQGSQPQDLKSHSEQGRSASMRYKIGKAEQHQTNRTPVQVVQALVAQLVVLSIAVHDRIQGQAARGAGSLCRSSVYEPAVLKMRRDRYQERQGLHVSALRPR